MTAAVASAVIAATNPVPIGSSVRENPATEYMAKARPTPKIIRLMTRFAGAARIANQNAIATINVPTLIASHRLCVTEPQDPDAV